MKLMKLWDADIYKAFELQNSFEEDENGFMNNVVGCSIDEFKEYVAKKENSSKGIELREGYVPDTTFVLVNENEEYVGIFNLRHYLNEFLKRNAGHIGYGIRREFRGKGYATEGLKLIIEEAFRIIPEDEIYMSVHKDNPASLHVQLKNNAYVHHEDDKKFYLRIKRKKF